MTHIIIIISALYLLTHCIVALVMNNNYRKRIINMELSDSERYRKMKHNMAHIAPVIAIGVAALLAVLINSVSLIMDINIDIDNNTRSIYMVHATDLVYSTMSICVTWIIRHIQDEEGGVFKY